MPVVPHAGTWIEMVSLVFTLVLTSVVPHAGTWIEIGMSALHTSIRVVVPHAGTWIEINGKYYIHPVGNGRSPRGNVD